MDCFIQLDPVEFQILWEEVVYGTNIIINKLKKEQQKVSRIKKK